MSRAPNLVCSHCGKAVWRRSWFVKNGLARFCSQECHYKSRSAKQRPSLTPEYRTWVQMNRRCTDPNDDSFQHYGSRGIVVCERWKASFENFLADMGKRPLGMSIDRIDNDKNYEPSNCRWATAQQQAQNRPSVHMVEFMGETKCVAAWCREMGLVEHRIRQRINRGWPAPRAFTTHRSGRHHFTQG